MSVAKKPPSLAGSDLAGERHQGFQALGVAVSKLAAPIAAKRRGGVVGRLKADWPVIVGPDWAAAAWPSALERDGALKLLVRPPAALELQHRAPLLSDRINLYLGRAIVTRLVLLQTTLPFVAEIINQAPRSPDANVTKAAAAVSGIADPGLRVAMERLATAVTIAEGRPDT